MYFIDGKEADSDVLLRANYEVLAKIYANLNQVATSSNDNKCRELYRYLHEFTHVLKRTENFKSK